MTTIVTLTTSEDAIQQRIFTVEDPIDLYENLERLVEAGEVKYYSMLTLKSHNSPVTHG